MIDISVHATRNPNCSLRSGDWGMRTKKEKCKARRTGVENFSLCDLQLQSALRKKIYINLII
jgi:hypothetical protein